PRVIHRVHVVTRQHDQLMRILAKNRIEVLVYRVRGAEVPVLTDAFLRVQHFDELAKLLRDDIPAHAEMAGEGQRFVLQRDEDLPQPRVDAAAEREVDDAARAAEIDGG